MRRACSAEPGAERSEYELLKEVVIPAGEVLSRAAAQRGGRDCVEVPVAIGRDATAWLVLPVSAIVDAEGWLEKRS